MSRHKSWEVDVYVAEDDRFTRAAAVLRRPGYEPVTGHGLATRNLTDEQAHYVGDELACARALNELSARLLTLAEQDIEAIEGRPIALRI
jgi:hypothetical protein